MKMEYLSFKKLILRYVLYNLCNPFNPDLCCAFLCGVEFVFKQERRGKESAAKVRIE